MAELPVLSLITFLPAVAAVALAFVPDGREVKGGAFAGSVLVLVLSLVLLWQFEPPVPPALAYAEDMVWVESLGIHYRMGVDGISLLLIVLTALLSPLAMVISWKAIHQGEKGFHIALLLLQTAVTGVFAAADLFLFYVFWEVMLLPMALLIGIWGGPRRIYASIKFVLYTMTGSLLMLVAILYCWWVSGQAGAPTLEITALQSILPSLLPASVEMWLFAAFALSFAIKVPMFPFHTWLPDAHVEAPTAGSVILAGVLLKMGTYGFLRFAIPFFPEAAVAFTTPILILSATGIIYGSLMCMAQADIKKLIAYSSVAHLGFVMLGIFSGTVIGAQGGMIQMINHGISTGALFLLVGVIYERAHTRGVRDFGGLAKVMPVYATVFVIITLSSIGLPGLNGFVGEFLILLGTFQTAPVAAVVGAFGVVLGAIYMLTLVRHMFFGPLPERWATLPDVTTAELATLVPLVAVAVLVGFVPTPFLALTEAPITHAIGALNQTATLAAAVAP